MKHLKYALILILLSAEISAFCQTSQKSFIGIWKTTRNDSRSYSISEEKWEFKDLKTGAWNRKLILSDGAIICLLKNPFIWQITSANKLKMTLGKTECKCTASNKKFEEGMEGFVNNLKASYSGEFFLHKIKVIDAKTITLDDFNLSKE